MRRSSGRGNIAGQVERGGLIDTLPQDAFRSELKGPCPQRTECSGAAWEEAEFGGPISSQLSHTVPGGLELSWISLPRTRAPPLPRSPASAGVLLHPPAPGRVWHPGQLLRSSPPRPPGQLSGASSGRQDWVFFSSPLSHSGSAESSFVRLILRASEGRGGWGAGWGAGGRRNWPRGVFERVCL